MVCAANAQTSETVAYAWEPVAAGAYAHYGRIEDFASNNHGDISNAGLVIGSRCAAIIDTGGSPRVGRAQLAALRAITDKPICYVINTHVHPDHMMGNATYAKEPQVQFAGSEKLTAAMNSRGRIYLNAMQRELGEDASGAKIISPSITVIKESTLDLGDRRLRLKAWPTAHTDHDLTVYDETSGTLWTGDLLFVTHAPVVDGSVKGWLAVLKDLEIFKAQRVVPGHGRAEGAWPNNVKAQARYLLDMESKIRDAIQRGKSLPQTLAENESFAPALQAEWSLLESFHRRNLTAVYAELEWE
jgi:quinoprotein relay system zinc metallohydrolase 2